MTTKLKLINIIIVINLLVFHSFSTVVMKHTVFFSTPPVPYFLCNLLHNFQLALTLHVKQIPLPLSVIKSTTLRKITSYDNSHSVPSNCLTANFRKIYKVFCKNKFGTNSSEIPCRTGECTWLLEKITHDPVVLGILVISYFGDEILDWNSESLLFSS